MFRLSALVAAASAVAGVSASAIEQTQTHGHHNKIETAVAAVKLMQSGVEKYLGEPGALKSERASEKLLADMLGNFRLLGKVLGECSCSSCSCSYHTSTSSRSTIVIDYRSEKSNNTNRRNCLALASEFNIGTSKNL